MSNLSITFSTSTLFLDILILNWKYTYQLISTKVILYIFIKMEM